MKVSVIFGTRPEAIKLAPVLIRLRNIRGVQCSVCVTGQHREMLDQVLDVFRITPDHDLNIMRPDQSLSDLTARLLKSLSAYMKQERPDIVIVQGDTTTAFVGALAAFYNNIPVAHVEAGLRTGNLRSPWPEEANRILVSRLAEFHFAPTNVSRDNLLKEGIPAKKIFVTGNTVIDALKFIAKKVRISSPSIPGSIRNAITKRNGGGFVLITGHRRENFGRGLSSICKAIIVLADKFPDVQFIYAIHLNPNVRRVVLEFLGSKRIGKSQKNVHLIEPVPYPSFVFLMDRCRMVLTDSGGIQEEAPSLGKPVLIMRDTTERSEVIRVGAAKLIGTNENVIVREVSRLLTDEKTYSEMSCAHNLYGNGDASKKILAILLKKYPVRKPC